MNIGADIRSITLGKPAARLLAAGYRHFDQLTIDHSVARGQRPRGRSAFTLIEMVVSLSIISIVFLAMGSVMLLASKALPTADASSSLTPDTADIVQQIVSELQTATLIAATTDKSITFMVPDRDNDGNDESVAYFWSGVAGNPLIRIYNGGTSVTVLPIVTEFNLAYDTKTVAQPDLLTESVEIELSSRIQSADTKNYAVSKNNWIGQYFKPTVLPAGAVSWNVTRALVMARDNGAANGQTLVQFRPPESGTFLPGNTVLDQVTMVESDLTGSYAWHPFVFSNVRDLAPGDGLCLVLQWVFDKNAADILYNDNTAGNRLTTSDAGSSWNVKGGKSMVYYVYGTYNTAVPQPPILLLKSVTLTVNAGASPASRVLTKVVTLNQPVMP